MERNCQERSGTKRRFINWLGRSFEADTFEMNFSCEICRQKAKLGPSNSEPAKETFLFSAQTVNNVMLDFERNTTVSSCFIFRLVLFERKSFSNCFTWTFEYVQILKIVHNTFLPWKMILDPEVCIQLTVGKVSVLSLSRNLETFLWDLLQTSFKNVHPFLKNIFRFEPTNNFSKIHVCLLKRPVVDFFF